MGKAVRVGDLQPTPVRSPPHQLLPACDAPLARPPLAEVDRGPAAAATVSPRRAHHPFLPFRPPTLAPPTVSASGAEAQGKRVGGAQSAEALLVGRSLSGKWTHRGKSMYCALQLRPPTVTCIKHKRAGSESLQFCARVMHVAGAAAQVVGLSRGGAAAPCWDRSACRGSRSLPFCGPGRRRAPLFRAAKECRH